MTIYAVPQPARSGQTTIVSVAVGGLGAADTGLAVTVTATSAVTAGLTAKAPLATTAAATSTVTAGLTANAALAATTAPTSTVTAGLTDKAALAVTATATSTVTANLSGSGSALTGTITATSTVTANLAGGAASARRLGAGLVVTVAWVPRPTGQAHIRALGAMVIRGQMILGPPSLVRVRKQGTPVLSGRVNTTGLVHARQLGTPEVNVRFLAPIGVSRA